MFKVSSLIFQLKVVAKLWQKQQKTLESYETLPALDVPYWFHATSKTNFF